jgi:hypothetical protein
MMAEQHEHDVQHTQPDTVRWLRVTAHVGGVVALLLLALAFFTFNAIALLLSFVTAIAGLIAGIRARAEVGITLAALAIIGCVALIVGVSL